MSYTKRRIINPYNKSTDNSFKCFGCSTSNPLGLHLEFFDEGDDVISFWKPQLHFSGYKNVLHGGIQATLLDEIASWVVFTRCKASGVTASMEMKYRKAVYANSSQVKLRAYLVEQKSRIAIINAELIDENGVVCAEATVRYFLFKGSEAQEKLGYPGPEAFYDEEI